MTEKTMMVVTIIGGKHDGRNVKISIPTDREGAKRMRLFGVEYHVRHRDDRILLVDPMAVALYPED